MRPSSMNEGVEHNQVRKVSKIESIIDDIIRGE